MWDRAGLGLFQGSSIFTVLLWRLSHFARIVLVCAPVKVLLLPALPLLWVGLGKYLKTFHWGSQCDGTWWLPLTGLSWLPLCPLAAPSVYSGTFPTPICWRWVLKKSSWMTLLYLWVLKPKNNFSVFYMLAVLFWGVNIYYTTIRNLRTIVTCALYHRHPVLFSQLCKLQTQPHSD